MSFFILLNYLSFGKFYTNSSHYIDYPSVNNLKCHLRDRKQLEVSMLTKPNLVNNNNPRIQSSNQIIFFQISYCDLYLLI